MELCNCPKQRQINHTHRPICLNTWSQLVELFGRITSCGPAGQGVCTGGVSKLMAAPVSSLTLPSACESDIYSQLLLQCHATHYDGHGLAFPLYRSGETVSKPPITWTYRIWSLPCLVLIRSSISSLSLF